MRRRAPLWLAVLFAASMLVGCNDSGDPDAASPLPQTELARRHVLLLTVDTLRSDHLSRHGHALPTTPYLDSLLDAAVVFPNTVAPVPRTTPSLASLLTGAYPHTTGVRTLVDPLDDDVVSLAETLRGAGYRTVAVVSNHVLSRDRRLDRGFDVYDAADDRRDAAATNRAVFGHLEGLSRDTPLLLWVHYIDPHVPYLPPPDIVQDFTAEGYSGPYRDGFGQRPGGIGDLAYPADLPKIEAVYRNPLPDDVNDHVRRLYAGDVRTTDEHIAQLVEGLRSRFRNDWSLVFTADHGEALGEHDFFYDHGDYVDNPSLVVPLAFVPPPGDRSATPRTVPQWVSLVDVAPTLLDWLGVAPDDVTAFEGRSLMPLLKGNAMEPVPVYAESGRSFYPQEVQRRQIFNVEGRFRTVLLGDWKLVWTPGHDEPFQLFDLAEDPGETTDLYAPDHPQGQALRSHLGHWLRSGTANDTESRDASTLDISPEDAERLRSLGYMP